MLVLDRKNSQGFWIGGTVYIKVLAIGARRVKLGVEAPAEVVVLRDELRSEVDGNDGAARPTRADAKRGNGGT
jgi:carbon storage regulator CsrA